jgi:glycosyltransferase involved in cell wall biosynthesis
VAPHGSLDAWALGNSRWKKRVAAWLFKDEQLRRATCLRALCEAEAGAMRAYGLRQRIEVVPNGVGLPEMGKAESGNAEKLKRSGRRRLLFLGRIHPKKGLVGLLRAWAGLKRECARWGEWELVVAGWDQGGHEGELRGLCGELGLRIADGGGEGNAETLKTEKLKGEERGAGSVERGGGGGAADGGGLIAEDGCQRSEDRSQRSEVRGQRSEDGGGGNAESGNAEKLKGEEHGALSVEQGAETLKNKLAEESELARDCENASLTRCASGPADSEDLKLNSYKLKTPPPEASGADVVFWGPAFGGEKEALLRSAEAFVLPSLSEGLPMSVLEGWAYGLPVVMTPECNLPEGFASGAALEIRNGGEENLKSGKRKAENWEGLRALVEMGEGERRAMGMRGRRLVEERFIWPKVAARMREIYESLL